MVTALQFFMGSDEPAEDSEDEDEVNNLILVERKKSCNVFFAQDMNEVMRETGMATRVNKKSRKREKQLGKVKKTLKVT